MTMRGILTHLAAKTMTAPGGRAPQKAATAEIWRKWLLAGVLSITSLSHVAAQDYPTHPVNLVVGYAPGGITDVLARLVAEPLGGVLGQPVVVENRPGAGSQLALKSVATAKPDGYTLAMGSSDGMMLIPATQLSPPYDVNNDFTPISLIRNERGAALAVSPALGVTTLDELIELAKTRPGGLRIGNTGLKGTPHLQALMFEQAVGAKQIHVPYSGAGPAATALIADQIDMIFLTPTTAEPLHRDGRAVVVAQTHENRHYLFPDVPTTREAGLSQDIAVDSWLAIFGPPKMDRAVVDQLAEAISAVLSDPQIIAEFEKRGMDLQSMGPDELKLFVAEKLETYTALAEEFRLRE